MRTSGSMIERINEAPHADLDVETVAARIAQVSPRGLSPVPRPVDDPKKQESPRRSEGIPR